jgi:DNA-binding response OmpR family regulator
LAKQNILIVDSDPESVKVLEVSLKKAGYSVTKSADGLDALEMVGFAAPDLIISDTKMPNLDGFGLCTKLKENKETAHIPFIFLTSEKSIEDKIRGLELGVEDYLNKPIFVREILVRVNLALQRREKERLENRTGGTKSKFSGSLQDMGVVDLLQTIDLGHKSGVIHLKKSDDTGNIFFRDGQVINAKTDTRSGAYAVYRMLVWSEGTFEIEFKAVDQEQRIELSTQGLLMEGMRQLDEWGRLQEQLPPLTSVFDVDEDVLAERLGEIPDEVNTILRHFDGRSPLMDVVDRAGLGDLEALTVISKLYFEGLILEVPPKPTIPAPAETEAILSDESLISKSKPERVPSKVVDDAIGPHLSVAADPLGFVRALTQSAPPSAPVPEEEVTKPGLDASSDLSELQKEKTKRDAVEDEIAKEAESKEEPVKKIKPTKLAAITPKKMTVEEHRTMMGLQAPNGVKPSAMSEKTGPDTLTNIASPGETQTIGSKASSGKRALPSINDIAAAIDAELPPPRSDDDILSEDSAEISGYFDGDAYKASFSPRQSYEPSFSSEEEDEMDLEEDDLEDDVSSLPPSNVLNLDDDDDWGEEHEDEPSIPTNLKAIIPVVVLLILAVIGGVYFFLQDETTEPSETEEPKTADNEPVQSTPLTVATKPRPTPETSPPETPDNPKPEENAKPESANTSADQGENGLQEKPVDDAKPEETTPPLAAASPETGEPPQKKTLTTEEKVAFNQLLAEIEKSGKRRKIKLLQEALQIDPTSSKINAMLSIELLESKQTREEAFGLAKKAIALNPDNAMGWLAKGYIHQLNNEKNEAKEAYRRCAECSGPGEYRLECRRLAR